MLPVGLASGAAARWLGVRRREQPVDAACWLGPLEYSAIMLTGHTHIRRLKPSPHIEISQPIGRETFTVPLVWNNTGLIA
jgi:hypothetical protein